MRGQHQRCAVLARIVGEIASAKGAFRADAEGKANDGTNLLTPRIALWAGDIDVAGLRFAEILLNLANVAMAVHHALDVEHEVGALAGGQQDLDDGLVAKDHGGAHCAVRIDVVEGVGALRHVGERMAQVEVRVRGS